MDSLKKGSTEIKSPPSLSASLRKRSKGDPEAPGIFTFDGIDYVLRGASMTGASVEPVDCRQLFHYSSFLAKRLMLDRRGLDALALVPNVQLYLYPNVSIIIGRPEAFESLAPSLSWSKHRVIIGIKIHSYGKDGREKEFIPKTGNGDLSVHQFQSLPESP